MSPHTLVDFFCERRTGLKNDVFFFFPVIKETLPNVKGNPVRPATCCGPDGSSQVTRGRMERTTVVLVPLSSFCSSRQRNLTPWSSWSDPWKSMTCLPFSSSFKIFCMKAGGHPWKASVAKSSEVQSSSTVMTSSLRPVRCAHSSKAFPHSSKLVQVTKTLRLSWRSQRPCDATKDRTASRADSLRDRSIALFSKGGKVAGSNSNTRRLRQ
mmetsp:Transcript_4816/g.12253  ORF Transcript_4816/g.12253 Transcript_4816/m.12253 type:complete len:211 (+) Transcript_4816:1118-1750(+)